MGVLVAVAVMHGIFVIFINDMEFLLWQTDMGFQNRVCSIIIGRMRTLFQNPYRSFDVDVQIDEHETAEKGQLVGALFLDLSKAFDTISHDVILEKLKRYGVFETELDWFKDYLFMRSQQVEIGNRKSKSHSIFSGVPQGSILRPLLFLVFFNDFPEILQHSKCTQYADDTVIMLLEKLRLTSMTS